jgi:hypothetical protein
MDWLDTFSKVHSFDEDKLPDTEELGLLYAQPITRCSGLGGGSSTSPSIADTDLSSMGMTDSVDDERYPRFLCFTDPRCSYAE